MCALRKIKKTQPEKIARAKNNKPALAFPQKPMRPFFGRAAKNQLSADGATGQHPAHTA
jgi:hypothetical protein